MKTNVPTVDEFFAFARSVEGEQLQTLHRGRPFKIAVLGHNIIEVTPGTRSPRNSTRDRITRVLDKLKETGSFQPGTYTEDTFNASYVLALVKLWQESQ